MSTSETIRFILEEYLEREPKRQQSLRSINRSVEVLEYIFASVVQANKRVMDQERMRQLLMDVSDNIRRFHPEL